MLANRNWGSTMNILLTPMGTRGDVDPHVGLGRALQRHGHRVTVIANSYYATLVQGAELEFVACGDAEDFKAKLNNPGFWDPGRSVEFALREVYLPAIRPLYQAIAERREPSRTVVAGPMMAMGTRMAHDKLGVAWATIFLQPAFLRSVIQPAEGYSFLLPRWAPRFYRRLWYRAADRWFDQLCGPTINAFRAELGLPAVAGGFFEWIRSPMLQLGMFPSWFAPPPPDWPAVLRLTGFPLADNGGVETMPPEARQFLDAGPPPVVFTFGTGMRQARDLFAESVAACRLCGCRGMLLTRFKEQLPASLPEGVRHFDFLPFSELLPRVAAVVHHGGIGTLAQTLAAGVPQVIAPFAYDQPDNAARLERLGLAAQVPHAEFRAARVAEALKRLLGSPEVASRCKDYAARVRGASALEDTARAMEGLLPGGQ
jgi:rhamnosyltransferase subunit B